MNHILTALNVTLLLAAVALYNHFNINRANTRIGSAHINQKELTRW